MKVVRDFASLNSVAPIVVLGEHVLVRNLRTDKRALDFGFADENVGGSDVWRAFDLKNEHGGR
jgi:hypothetical protein